MPTEDPVVDVKYMERCLMLALQAEGRTAPNPVVGAVVLDAEGEVVGEGFHAQAGEPHAEVNALNAAGDRARGGTLYVNLEPCCHHGRTGPCSQRVIASGVARVVVGMGDPNPKVAGGGIEELRNAGITVDVGVLPEECWWANRAFVSVIRNRRPWVCLKMASTLDGRIADRDGMSQWISGPQARAHVHALRNIYDCVLVGSETARRDNPSLTVRDVPNGRDPHRAVLDAKLALPRDLKLFQPGGKDHHVFVLCSNNPDSSPWQDYPRRISLQPVKEVQGRLDLEEVLWLIGQARVNSVLCEGGGRLAANLLSLGLVDEVQWIVAPKLLCDVNAVPSVALGQALRLADAPRLERVRISQLGDDALIEGTFRTPSL